MPSRDRYVLLAVTQTTVWQRVLAFLSFLIDFSPSFTQITCQSNSMTSSTHFHSDDET